jgi:hypothetical protein
VRGILALVVVLGVAASAEAQSPAPDPQPVVLRGRIVSAANDAALRRARVAAVVPSGRVDPVLTDDEGRFLLTLPSRTSISLTATKAGYAAMTVPVALKAIDSEVTLRLARGAAIFGRVVDAADAPVADVPVAVRRVGGTDEGPRHVTTTDDLGEYRLGGLPAGRYRLLAGSASPVVIVSGTPPTTTVIVRAPNASAPAGDLLESDQTIDVAAGDDVAAADLRVPQPTAADRRAQLLAQSGLPAAGCPGDASLRVRVTTVSGEPVGGVSVRLTTRETASKGAALVSAGETTASNGITVFDCLRPFEYAIEVSKAGYLVDRYGDRRALQMTATARDGQVNETPTVVLRRLAAAVGTVTDEHGEPLQGVRVRALAVRYANGRTSAVPVGTARQTDDRGQFRVYGLQPGAYLLTASVDAAPSGAGTGASAYVPSYFPGTPDIGSAEEVRIAADDVTGLNVLFTQSPAARVSGIALDSAGQPVVRGSVQLAVSQRSGAVAPEPVTTTIGAAGEFVLSNVPPGDYVVHAIRFAGLGLRAEIGSAQVSIARGNPPPLTIRTSDGTTMTGRLIVDDSERRSVAGLSMSAFPVDVDRATPEGRGIVFLGDGTFFATGIHGSTRVAMTVGPEGWYLKAVRIAGADVTDEVVDFRGDDVDDVEIAISTAGASLAGRTDDASRIDDYAVIVFPVDPNLRGAHSRHMKLAPSSADGTFRVNGLPPGTYWAAALDPEARIDNGAWQDPAFLDRLAAQASRVTLSEGERRTVTLRLAR